MGSCFSHDRCLHVRKSGSGCAGPSKARLPYPSHLTRNKPKSGNTRHSHLRPLTTQGSAPAFTPKCHRTSTVGANSSTRRGVVPGCGHKSSSGGGQGGSPQPDVAHSRRQLPLGLCLCEHDAPLRVPSEAGEPTRVHGL